MDFAKQVCDELGIDLEVQKNKPLRPWYNHRGKCVEYLNSDEAYIADWVDNRFQVYRSMDDDRIIGCCVVIDMEAEESEE